MAARTAGQPAGRRRAGGPRRVRVDGDAGGALETLSPLERAVFLLHDVFEFGYSEVAEAVGRAFAPSRSCTLAATTHITSSSPSVSVTMNRLRPPTFFRVITLRTARDGVRGLDALRIDDPRARFRVAALSDTNLFAQLGQDPLGDFRLVPCPEPAVDGLPRREVGR
jgi:hypothetical protein